MASALVGYNWPGSESTAGSRGLMGPGVLALLELKAFVHFYTIES